MRSKATIDPLEEKIKLAVAACGLAGGYPLAAKVTGLSVGYFKRANQERRPDRPVYRKHGRRVIFHTADLVRWSEKHKDQAA